MQATKEVNPHLALRHVSICWVSSSSSSSSFATCWVLVDAYATSSRKGKWSGPHQQNWEENEFKFHSVTYYTYSIISSIHVNPTKLRNTMCTLVTTGVILRSLECTPSVHSRILKCFMKGAPPSSTSVWIANFGFLRQKTADRGLIDVTLLSH